VCCVVVVVLCASPDTVREIMIAADELNFDNGEYVFFNIDLFARSRPLVSQSIKQWIDRSPVFVLFCSVL